MIGEMYITSDGTYFDDHNAACRHDEASEVKCLDEDLNEVVPNRPSWDNVEYIYLPTERAWRNLRDNMEEDGIIVDGIARIGWVHWNWERWDACDCPL